MVVPVDHTNNVHQEWEVRVFGAAQHHQDTRKEATLHTTIKDTVHRVLVEHLDTSADIADLMADQV
jgi:hypothetical protein